MIALDISIGFIGFLLILLCKKFTDSHACTKVLSLCVFVGGKFVNMCVVHSCICGFCSCVFLLCAFVHFYICAFVYLCICACVHLCIFALCIFTLCICVFVHFYICAFVHPCRQSSDSCSCQILERGRFYRFRRKSQPEMISYYYPIYNLHVYT